MNNQELLENRGRSLPNSKWLQDILDLAREDIIGFYIPNYDREDLHKKRLEMMDSVLDKCAKTGEGRPIYFTEKEWEWVSRLLLEEDWYFPYEEEEREEGGVYGVVNDRQWLASYNWYCDIVEKEKVGFRFPFCGYECKFAYVKIDWKIYKRHTGNIHDDQEYIDAVLKGARDRKSVYESIYGRCPQCLVPYGGIHHLNCSYERCPICLDQPGDCDDHVAYERLAIPKTGDCDNHICYAHQFIICIHNSNVKYYREPIDDDGIFEPGFNYRLVNDGR